MEECKGTKGEWIATTNSHYQEVSLVTNKKRLNCNIFLYDVVEDNTLKLSLSEENEANAKLIAAAPDLLDALQAMLSRFKHVDEGYIKANHVKELAKKAINKALN